MRQMKEIFPAATGALRGAWCGAPSGGSMVLRTAARSERSAKGASRSSSLPEYPVLVALVALASFGPSRYRARMATELHDLTVPVFLRGLTAMAGFLDKGRAHADDTGMAHAELIEARLAPDMHPLPYQLQRACDFAKLAAVRLGQVENVPMEDTETSFAELQERIARTIAFLKAVPAEAVNGREDAEIVIKTPNRSFEMSGRDYALGFVLPNFYFHLTTAYALLRMKGVPVGKMDFIGAA
jgi:hypothetical protein